jgi:hypothetical protein
VSEQRQHIDDLIRDKFLSFEGDIPMSDWSAIEDKLNKKKRFAWLWWAAIPLLLIGSISFYALLNQDSSNNFVKQSEIKERKEIVKENHVIDNSEPTTPSTSENLEIKKSGNRLNNSKKGVQVSEADNSNNQKTNKEKLFTEETDLAPVLIQPTVSNSNSSEIIEMFNKPVQFNKVPFLNQTELAGFLTLEKPKAPKKLNLAFEVGLNLSPAMGMDAIKENRSKMIHRSYFSSIAGSSSLGNGFNTGINAQVNLNKNWFIRSGLYSSNYSVYHNFNYTITEAPGINAANDAIIGYLLIPNEKISYDGKSSIKYLSVPLQFGNRTYFSKAFGLESKLGFNFSRLVNASGQSVNPTFLNLEPINGNNSIRKWNSGVTISTGLFYKTKNNLIFTVEPNFSALLGSTKAKNYPVKTSYYNYGVNLNINYVLKGGNK